MKKLTNSLVVLSMCVVSTSVMAQAMNPSQQMQLMMQKQLAMQSAAVAQAPQIQPQEQAATTMLGIDQGAAATMLGIDQHTAGLMHGINNFVTDQMLGVNPGVNTGPQSGGQPATSMTPKQKQQQAEMMQMMQKQQLKQQEEQALAAKKLKNQQEAIREKMKEHTNCVNLAQKIENKACSEVRTNCELVKFTKGYYDKSEMKGWYNCREKIFQQQQSAIVSFKNSHPECKSIQFSSNASC